MFAARPLLVAASFVFALGACAAVTTDTSENTESDEAPVTLADEPLAPLATDAGTADAGTAPRPTNIAGGRPTEGWNCATTNHPAPSSSQATTFLLLATVLTATARRRRRRH